MVDITHKITTLRKAIAEAILCTSSPETIKAVTEKKVPKGDVFEMSKAAGLLAVKKTSDVIPDCHPMPIEYTRISHEISGTRIRIRVEVHTIYKTGVEVEAMYGASVVAMTMYDMLKPIDKGISIEKISLLEKEGGKSDFIKDTERKIKSAVIVISDAIASGKKQDTGGQYVLDTLKKNGVENVAYHKIPDVPEQLRAELLKQNQEVNLVIICGGTGFTKKDKTPETLRELLDTEIPGIMEAARAYGQNRTPYSMLSRGLAGLIGSTLVIAIPGSGKGARETMDCLFPSVLHGFNMLNLPR